MCRIGMDEVCPESRAMANATVDEAKAGAGRCTASPAPLVMRASSSHDGGAFVYPTETPTPNRLVVIPARHSPLPGIGPDGSALCLD